uniref:ubiquitin carboxyl-terminal hydrolase 47-like isoform X2 n=1 Tax=Pristiophorus japonicus TaxID=55135 RepID=UPI00398EC6AA
MRLVIQVKRAARLLFPVVFLYSCLFGRCYWYNLFCVFRKMCAIVTKRSTGAVNRMGSKPVFVGLINQGATCYLNTLLQTWFMTPEVKCHIGSLKSDVPFVLELQSLYEKLESREEMFLWTNELTSSLSLNVFKQCDIEECFRNLINKLNVEVDQGHKILKLYQITMVQSMKCSGCTNLVEDDTFFLDIPLPICSDTSSENVGHLETALQAFLKEDTMESDHKCYCDHCRTKTKTKIRYYFKHLPQILTFQLKRFEVVGNWMYYQKCHDCITIPLALEFNKSQDNCSKWCLKPTMDKEYNAFNNHQSQNIGRGQPSIQAVVFQEEDPGEADRTVGHDAVRKPVAAQDQSQQNSTEETERKYELFAIWHHSGEYGSGHYYAEIKSVDDGNWYCFNDQIVEKKKQVSQSSKTAYLIMYRKID